MQIKSISFILENMDMITIDGKFIGDFVLSDIRTSFSRVACNAISKMNICHSFAIEISKKADKEYYQLGCHDENHKDTFFHRLSEGNDITQIEFTYAEYEGPETEYHYYMNWVGDNEYANEAQKAYVSEQGNLYIVIDENRKIEDYFDKGEIDDQEAMDFKFDMYNV